MAKIETQKTSYGTNQPESVIYYTDCVVVNSDIASEEITDQTTDETSTVWSAIRTVYTLEEYKTLRDSVETQYKTEREQYESETDAALLELDEMLCGFIDRMTATLSPQANLSQQTTGGSEL